MLFIIPPVTLIAIYLVLRWSILNLSIPALALTILMLGFFPSVAEFTLRYFNGGKGAGFSLLLMSAILGAMGILALLFFGRRLVSSQAARLHKVVGLASALLLTICLLAPQYGIYSIGRSCDRTAAQSGNLILNAAEEYHDREGAYPESPANLLPGYVDRLPAPTCLPEMPATIFQFETCQATDFLITFPSADGLYLWIRSPAWSEWRYGNIQDGACLHLK